MNRSELNLTDVVSISCIIYSSLKLKDVFLAFQFMESSLFRINHCTGQTEQKQREGCDIKT
jgi:hypothetical protein